MLTALCSLCFIITFHNNNNNNMVVMHVSVTYFSPFICSRSWKRSAHSSPSSKGTTKDGEIRCVTTCPPTTASSRCVCPRCPCADFLLIPSERLQLAWSRSMGVVLGIYTASHNVHYYCDGPQRAVLRLCHTTSREVDPPIFQSFTTSAKLAR